MTPIVQVQSVFVDQAATTHAIHALLDESIDYERDLRVYAMFDGIEQELPLVYRDRPEQMALLFAAIGVIGGGIGAAAIALGLIPGITMFPEGPLVGAAQAGAALGSVGFAIGAMFGLGMGHVTPEFARAPAGASYRVVVDPPTVEHRVRAHNAFDRVGATVMDAEPHALAHAA